MIPQRNKMEKINTQINVVCNTLGLRGTWNLITITFNPTQLFCFQNISSLFSANKSKHTTSNLKFLKRYILGRCHSIFIFMGEFPQESNQGKVDNPLQTMNTKHQVLNTKKNSFLLLTPNICKCKNKNKSNRSSHH